MKHLIHEVRVFENAALDLFEEGHVLVSTRVVDSSLNYYGNAHGGYLFTLCDQVSGLTALSTGYDAVTLQSSINYLKAAHLDDTLTIEGTLSHNGKSTKVVEVVISNQESESVAKGTFTMFVTGQNTEKIAFLSQ